MGASAMPYLVEVGHLISKKRYRRNFRLSFLFCPGFSSYELLWGVRISRYNAALSACTSGGLSTAGRCFVCLIDGLFVCRTGSIVIRLRRFAER